MVVSSSMKTKSPGVCFVYRDPTLGSHFLCRIHSLKSQSFPLLQVCNMWEIHTSDTADGRNPALFFLGCIIPSKKWDLYHINWLLSPDFCHQQYCHRSNWTAIDYRARYCSFIQKLQGSCKAGTGSLLLLQRDKFPQHKKDLL